MRKRLIVNGDDLGYTAGINRAIVECAQQGILTSATLMACGQAFEDAVKQANSADLRVGCHTVLVDGEPVSQVRRLARRSRFGSSSLRLAAEALDRAMAREIEAEAFAQVERLKQAGIRVTHVDSHKHTHMFPQILRPLLRGAKRAGVQKVRNPFEPTWTLSARERFHPTQRKRSVQVGLLRSLRGAFLRGIRQEGFVSTDGSLGVITTGTLNTRLLVHMLDRMPVGTWELVCHPGYDDQDLKNTGTRLAASREVEREALTSPEVKAAIERNGIELISFAEL